MDKSAFVLVHPAWHGGWCWKKLVPFLRGARHEVITPSLTGLGERSHLLRRDIGLDTHVNDIVNAIAYEDMSRVILLGHSSSGAVVTGVADLIPERIGQVIYLDAFVPEDGQAVIDLIAPERRRMMESLVQAEGDGWLLPRFAPPAWETIVRDIWGVRDEGDLQWMVRLLRPTPFRHFTDPIRRSNRSAEGLRRSYIRCTQFPNPHFDRHAELAMNSAHWSYRELSAGHHPFVTMPRETAELLLELV
jgi:pimeloyl-ACP methyl ester carboxylesterase